MDPAQRAQLLATKLRVLVTEHAAGWEVRADTLVPVAFFAGAAALAAKVLFVLVEPSTAERDPMDTDPSAQPRPPRGWLGGVVVLAQRHGCTEVNLMGDMLTGHDARRASRSMIPIRVWSIAGRVLISVDPVDHVAPDAASAEALAFESTIVRRGPTRSSSTECCGPRCGDSKWHALRLTRTTASPAWKWGWADTIGWLRP